MDSFIIPFLCGVAYTMICAFVGTLLREPRNPKYCPTCGRMLMVYERELDSQNKLKDARYKKDSRLNKK